MSVCVFFGHRDCPDTIRTKLRNTLIALIVNHGVDIFYVGNQGQFDAIVRGVLRELQEEYPQIHYAVVLAYLPIEKRGQDTDFDTMLPEGMESVHPRYAISWRNNWMLRQADYVVTYITHSWGGAAQYAAKAKRQGKIVINLSPNVQIG